MVQDPAAARIKGEVLALALVMVLAVREKKGPGADARRRWVLGLVREKSDSETDQGATKLHESSDSFL